jgi:hypothetical protein
MSKTLREHVFIHSFRTGNRASVRLRVPHRGSSFRYFVHFARDPVPADDLEYSRWQRHVANVLGRTAGRRLEMIDDADRPAYRRATKATAN